MKADVVVIGGGPAGMMAAGRAAENGARVILLEKNDSLGKKLLMTGNGRCNLANAEEDINVFIDRFGKQGKFLHSILKQFDINDTLNFFNQRGLQTKIEAENRVFPESDNAYDVLQVLMDYMQQTGVIIIVQAPVIGVIKRRDKIAALRTEQESVFARNYILCTGGLSYPSTGSSGDGFNWAKDLGHTVIPPEPVLTPVILKEPWVKDLSGLSLKNVRVDIFQNNKKQDERQGDALFTFGGMSGPIILDMSKKVGELLKTGKVELRIDFFPDLYFELLDRKIQYDWKEISNKQFKNSLDQILPKSLIPVIVHLSEINPNKKVNNITKEERKKLIHLLKELKVSVKSLAGFDRAVVTAGGVDLREVDPKTLKSKIIDNLYFAGEVLDLDGPTGGYNLQISWSTGYVAGEHASKFNVLSK